MIYHRLDEWRRETQRDSVSQSDNPEGLRCLLSLGVIDENYSVYYCETQEGRREEPEPIDAKHLVI